MGEERSTLHDRFEPGVNQDELILQQQRQIEKEVSSNPSMMPQLNGYSLNAKLLRREYGLSTVNKYDFVLRKLKKSYNSVRDFDNEKDFWRSSVFASHFCPNRAYGSVLAAANEYGQIMLWDMKRNVYKDNYEVTEAHDFAIFDMAWSQSEMKLVTASGDKSVAIWDVARDLKIQKIQTYWGHACTVKTIAWNPETSNMFSSGDRSGVIVLWDTRTDRPENVIYSAHERRMIGEMDKHSQLENATVSGLAFYQPYYLISAAAGTPSIRMWDLRKYYGNYSRKPQPAIEFRHDKYDDRSGYSYLNVDPVRRRLYATSVYDRIYSFALDTADCRPASVLGGGLLRSFYAKSSLSPDGNYILSGSTSEYAVIWSTNQTLGEHVPPLRKLTTNGLEVNTVAWCNAPGYELKVAVFPECEPCVIYDINPKSIATLLWDCGPLEPETTNSYDQEIEYIGDTIIRVLRPNRRATE